MKFKNYEEAKAFQNGFGLGFWLAIFAIGLVYILQQS
jgi:hypothetical protein